jgi:hypothetical protein
MDMNSENLVYGAVGAVCGGAVGYLIGCRNRAGSGDDQPIILSGGSPLHIEPRNRKFRKVQDNDPDRVHHWGPYESATTSRKVTDVDVTVGSKVPNLIPPAGHFRMTIKAKPIDIFLDWEPGGEFTISGTYIVRYLDSNTGCIHILDSSADRIIGDMGAGIGDRKWLDQPIARDQKWCVTIHYRGPIGT